MNDGNVTTELARGWIEAWSRFDIAWLRERLAADFLHVSPFGRIAGRDRYLATVEPIARNHTHQLFIREIATDNDRAVVWFDNQTPSGTVPTCDWIGTVGGQISSVHSFYDSTLLREVMSANELRELGGTG